MVDETFPDAGTVRPSIASPAQDPPWAGSAPAPSYSGWRGIPRRLKRVVQRCRALLQLSETMADLRASLPEHVAQLSAHLRAVDQCGSAMHDELAGMRAQLAQHQAAVEAELHRIEAQVGPQAFAGLQRELSAQLAFSVYDILRRLVDNPERALSVVPAPVVRTEAVGSEAEVKRLANEQFETKNQLIHLGTSTEARLENLTTVATETKNAAIHLNTSLHTRLNTIERSLYDQMHDLTAALLRVRADIEAGTGQDRAPDPVATQLAVPRDVLCASLRRAQQEFPHIYSMWAERLEATRIACLETKAGNVAHAGDAASEAFRSFVEIHACGRVLDVGCGIFGRPYYLFGYPASLVSGLDPLEPVEPMDFEFVRGIQEYLPWPEGSFATVISATSLDHCLSLDRSLAEVRRVLRPEGRFLLWIGSQPGSPRFEPETANFTPADRFHLFHFDTAWFEPMLERWFDAVDRIRLRCGEFDHVMYCLRLRRPELSKEAANLAI
jgi:SAM-dependent methyltransferase